MLLYANKSYTIVVVSVFLETTDLDRGKTICWSTAWPFKIGEANNENAVSPGAEPE
jgi:hypothetical protein